MSSNLPDSRLFPSVSANRIVWAPVYLEPMPGSGERITAVVVAVDEVGAWHVELTVRSKILRCMFGEKGDLVFGIAALVQESVQDHLAMRGGLEGWIPPITTCFLGPLRPATGESPEVVARRAASLVASMATGEVPIDHQGEAPTPEVDRWLQQIRTSVRERNELFDLRFNGEVRSKNNASPTRIGYLGDRIAANFDALVPGPNLSNKRIRSKSRLLDLQILKDQVDLFARRTAYELILWVPQPDSPAYPERSLLAARSVLAELEEFGDKHDLRVRPVHSADAAAEVLLTAEAA